jgi:DNA-binding transcriptional ArsR family regulator
MKLRKMIDIAKALSDANRVRALLLLADGPLCVCQIIEMLELAPSTTSKHMSILRQAGLVEADKQGRWMHYRLAGKAAPPSVQKAIRWITSELADDAQTQLDQSKLKKLLEMDKEALCRNQRS